MMNAPTQQALYSAPVTVRKNLNFELNARHVPRFWFGNDPFRTRIFDALSLTFPEGERYFICSVRRFRDQIKTQSLHQKVTDFIQQEAQHGLAHDTMNQLMIEQGMPIERMVAFMKSRFEWLLANRSPQYNLAVTAASEHLTALMADCFFSNKATLADANPHVRALLAWHAIEEMEHRDVAFDVMVDVARVPYLLRAQALVVTSALMFTFTCYRANQMLKADGFTPRERLGLFRRGLPWLLGKQGVLTAMGRPYRQWFKPAFHPNQHPVIEQYPVWVETLSTTGNPLTAGQAFWERGR